MPIKQPPENASPRKPAHTIRSENAIDKITTNRRASAKDRRVTKLLPKLLAALRQLTLAAGLRRRRPTNRLHGDIDGQDAVGRRGRGRRRRHALLLDAHVRPREDAFLARALADALPPLGIHVLGHGDAVVGLQRQVAGVGGRVGVERDGVRQRGGCGRWRRRRLGVRRGVALRG